MASYRKPRLRVKRLGHFEIVLHIHPEHGLPETPVALRARRWRVKTKGRAGQKVRNIEKCVVAPGVAGTDHVVVHSRDVHTRLEGMSSLDIREIITLLEHIGP